MGFKSISSHGVFLRKEPELTPARLVRHLKLQPGSHGIMQLMKSVVNTVIFVKLKKVD